MKPFKPKDFFCEHAALLACIPDGYRRRESLDLKGFLCAGSNPHGMSTQGEKISESRLLGGNVRKAGQFSRRQREMRHVLL